MNEIINSSTLRQGAAPWNTEIVSCNQNVKLDLWGQSANDIVKIRRVRVQEGAIVHTTNQTCCITPATKAQVKASKLVLRCDCNGSRPAELTTDVSFIILSEGAYVFEYSGSGFAAKTTVLTYAKTSKEACDCDCFPLPAPVIPPPPPVYCPSFRLDVCDCNEIGFAYRDGDSKDPAATVQILDCEGIAVGFGYPTPRVGATVPYTENNVVIGYLQNRSECAPEASTAVNVYNTNNVAAPTVNNAFAPTTNVAAPTVVLPAPTVASQTLDANDAIVTTLTNGTVFTTPLSNC